MDDFHLGCCLASPALMPTFVNRTSSSCRNRIIVEIPIIDISFPFLHHDSIPYEELQQVNHDIACPCEPDAGVTDSETFEKRGI